MPAVMAVAALIDVPWDQTNRTFHFELELLDSDGHPAELVGTPSFVRFGGEFEVGRPVGHPRGSAITVPLALNLPALPLAPDAQWEWRMSIDGETQPDWTLPFVTRPAGAEGKGVTLPET